MNEKELKEHFEIYTICWQLFKKYANPESTTEYWKALTAEAESIYKKHGSTKFVYEMLRTTMDELQRLEKNGKEN